MSALSVLEAMVQIPSVNPFRYISRPDGSGYLGFGSETAMNLFIEEWLREAGFEVTRQMLHEHESIRIGDKVLEVPARWNVLGVRYPKGAWNGRSILFFGHTDTVDVKQGWQSDPFSVTRRTIAGREVWLGLGVNDMKGGLSAILEAVRVAAAQEYAIKVAFVVDEEFYSFGADVLCKSDFMSDVALAIAPEIGGVLHDVSQKEGESVRSQQIGIGRTGRVEYDFEVIGRACHGADAFIHPDAVNAVHESAKLQVALAADCASVKREFVAHGVRVLNSAFVSFQHGGEAMLSVPDKAISVLDRTLLPDESPDAELLRLRQVVAALQSEGRVDPRAKITVNPRNRPTPACRPYVCDPAHPEIRRVIDAVRQHAERHFFTICRSVADENRVAELGIPTVTLGPLGSGSHTNQEWVDPQSVELVSEIYSALIRAS
jgi:acetylornithine deacetylase/succinyl-diaminopimelate desuccinylase-like protein